MVINKHCVTVIRFQRLNKLMVLTWHKQQQLDQIIRLDLSRTPSPGDQSLRYCRHQISTTYKTDGVHLAQTTAT